MDRYHRIKSKLRSPSSNLSTLGHPNTSAPQLTTPNAGPSRVQHHRENSLRRTIWHGIRSLIDIVGQSADACPALKGVLGGITALLRTYDVSTSILSTSRAAYSLEESQQVKGNKAKSASILRRLESFSLPKADKTDVKELERRTRLETCVFRTNMNHLQSPEPTCRALEPIYETLTRIMAQNLAERTANSVQDNDAVLGCVEDLSAALTDYQAIALI